jgi:hypothetical protein
MRKSREFPELAGLREAEWCWARLLMCMRSTAARSSGTSIGYQFRDYPATSDEQSWAVADSIPNMQPVGYANTETLPAWPAHQSHKSFTPCP